LTKKTWVIRVGHRVKYKPFQRRDPEDITEEYIGYTIRAGTIKAWCVIPMLLM